MSRSPRKNRVHEAPSNTAFTDDPLWYKDAVIYQLHVKSFCDGNGDGIGDFAGLIDKLDYIAELGVNTVWLLPFYPSPRRDDGRSEEHPSELQSLMRNSYSVFCLKTKNIIQHYIQY